MTYPRYPEFTDAANCRQPGVDIENFHPGKGNNAPIIAAAKAVCKGDDTHPACPFLDPCLDYALRVRDAGVWGGTTVKERARIRLDKGIISVPPLPIRDNAWIARQMASRGVAVRLIAERLSVTEGRVRAILSAAS
jgi:hypothetical protein